MDDERTPALMIAEEMLERTGVALKRGDFDDFAACFAYPHAIDTFDGPRILHDEDDLLETFDAVRAYYDTIGVTEIVRTCVAASYLDDRTIETTHETRLICNGLLTRRPFPVYTIIVHQDDRWLFRSSQYAIADSDDHNSALHRPQPGRASEKTL